MYHTQLLEIVLNIKFYGLQAGRTIITTIHQPSSRMFHMFDKLLLISEGYPVYYGKARESMDYFTSLRFIPEIPMNPAEFLLDLATGQVNDISVPADLLTLKGSPDYEKAVIKVRSSNLHAL
jgi:ABC-type multidrug transport system ATPase subunit